MAPDQNQVASFSESLILTAPRVRRCESAVHYIEDRRQAPVRGRATLFRLKQNTAVGCTFDTFVPGTDNDPDPSRTFEDYLRQFRENAQRAGRVLFGNQLSLQGNALAKVEGDVNELIEAATLWNAMVVWNDFMDTGLWRSKVWFQPSGAVSARSRKVAAVKLPRAYNPMRLFQPDVRAAIEALKQALRQHGMELGLSSPDIVGVRVPEPVPDSYKIFVQPLANLTESNRDLLESAYHKSRELWSDVHSCSL